MVEPVTWALWAAYAVLTAASVGYQVKQSQKQKDAAKKAREARKGFEVPIEGESDYLPIVYGRAKIGGARVFHQTQGYFYYPSGGTNAEKTFLTGYNPSESIPVIREDQRTAFGANGPEDCGPGFTWNAIDSVCEVFSNPTNSNLETRLVQTFDGSIDPKGARANAFIFFQQALCQGPIQACYDIIIDESRFLDDPTLGTDQYQSQKDKAKIEAAFRADVHLNGSEYDTIMAQNFGDRRSATFEDLAYASVFARLDRTNPQFHGVPVCQFLIEGRKIRTVSAGVLSGTRTYSNNPAWCLLDYLLDNISGKGIPESKIDLTSFEDAAAICDTTVASNKVVSGKIWKPTDGSRDVSSRNIPLYECNLIIDPKKPIRENVETLLSTMGDARLVWSQGQYRLSLEYPANNAAIPIVTTLTDDDFILDQEFEVNFPTASERLNHCIVKFHNESNNFKEDSASWPPKLDPNQAQTIEFVLGIGGEPYPIGSASGGWNPEKNGARLLNNYAVWNGSNYTATVEYKFVIPKEMAAQSTSFTLEFTADDQVDSISLNVWNNNNTLGASVYSASNPTTEWKSPVSQSVTLGNAGNDIAYRISITATDRSGETSEDEGSKTKGRGIAARLIQSGGMIVWSTRDPAYTAVTVRNLSNNVYRTYLDEDNGIELEEEVFADGITDYYHALAKAEELVRTSRGAFVIRGKQRVKNKFLEPGDFVQVQIEDLQLGTGTPLYCRVEEVELDDEFNAEIELSRFDSSFLAWNVADDEISTPPAIYDDRIPAPQYVFYSPPIGPLTYIGQYPDDHEGPGVKHPTQTTGDVDGWILQPGIKYYNTTDSLYYYYDRDSVWQQFVASDSEFLSAGTLTWGGVEYINFETYIVYCHLMAYGVDNYGYPIFRELGRTDETTFILPQIDADYAVFGVATMGSGSRTSEMTLTNVTWNATDSRYEVTPINLIRPWLDATGNVVFNPNGTITYQDGGSYTIAISDVVANAIQPSITFVGAYPTDHEGPGIYHPTIVTATADGWTYEQNAVYRNTTDGNQYILTGDPLDWEVYLPEGKIFYVIIDSSAGKVFRRNGSFSTTLSARLFKNGAEVTNEPEVLDSWFDWEKRDKDGVVDTVWTTANQDSKTAVVTQDDVDGTASFSVSVTTP